MKIAIEGCGHGELDNIYATILEAEQAQGIKVDLLICCGDFQAVRNAADLNSMSCPPKYRAMNTFYKYYSGEKVAPVMTIFIGGNHEASTYHWELPYGGWVAPNIFYLGFGGVVTFGGVRIAGLSGIFNEHHYNLGHFERPPFTDKDIRSFYHVREYDVFQLSQMMAPIDIFLSHDWPRGVTRFGNEARLLQQKKFFAKEVHENSLGSDAAQALLHHLRPSYWFSAHLHVKFPAVVPHDPSTALSPAHSTKTRFLALDKCLPHRDFLQILDIPASAPLELSYDCEWIAILKATAHLRPVGKGRATMPVAGGPHRSDFRVSPAEIKAVVDSMGRDLRIPHNFVQTAPCHNPGDRNEARMPDVVRENPQTSEFCSKFGLPNPCQAAGTPRGLLTLGSAFGPVGGAASNPDEISLDDDGEEGGEANNPDEIDLGNDEVPEDEDEHGHCGGGAHEHLSSHNPEAIALDDEEETGEVIVFKRRNQSMYTESS